MKQKNIDIAVLSYSAKGAETGRDGKQPRACTLNSEPAAKTLTKGCS